MSDVEALVRDTLAHKGLTNVHLLQKASVVLEGIRFVGATLWTAIAEGSAGSRINDFRKILGDEGRVFTVSDMSALHDDHAAFLQSELQTSSPHPTVVITHHLPTWSMIADKYVGDPMNNAFASSVLDTLLVVPRAWICGHSHSPVRKTVRGCECILHPWGYPGEDGVRGTTAVLTVDV
jgi:hypothetical protein